MSRPRQARRWQDAPRSVGLDPTLVLTTMALVSIGIVMVASASVNVAQGFGLDSYYFVRRHLMFIGIGLLGMSVFRFLGTAHLRTLVLPCMVLSVVVLLLPFLPGLGVEVNGSTRWIRLGVMRFQVVEAAKLLMIIFVAGYLSSRPDLNKGSWLDNLKPLLLVAVLGAILLKQPDMGSAMVIGAIVVGMIFLAGAPFRQLTLLLLGSAPLITYAALEPYRLARLMSFRDPFADPFNSGFQLTQALIAIGRGELTGVGLGSSIQKLFYLPEAHNDFIFAVYAEEMGFVGVVVLVGLFAILIGRMLVIGYRARQLEQLFSAYLVWGVALWIALQAIVSIGVNLGVLPTKGLTLPMISAGGSSLMMTLVAIGLVLRVAWEVHTTSLTQPRRRGWTA